MTTTISGYQIALPSLVRRCAILAWRELPGVVAVGALGAVVLAPLFIALALGSPLLVAIGMLPLALYLVGCARFAAAVVAGRRRPVREALHLDVVLGATLAAPCSAAVLLIGLGDGARLAGEGLAAVLALVTPIAVGYSAVRGCRGIAAWRGGLLLVAYRPAWALTLLSLSTLTGFAIVSTGGVLIVVMPYLSLLCVAICQTLLDEIDARRSG